MIRRAHKIFSSWESFHLEILNIRQLQVNNGFSNKNIEKINTLSNQNQEHNSQIRDKIKVLHKSQMSDAHETDGKTLKKIIKHNPTCEELFF